MNGDQAFDAAAGIGRLIADHYAAERLRKRDARNARRRANYRANPRPLRQRAAEPAVEPDVSEIGCRCFVVARGAGGRPPAGPACRAVVGVRYLDHCRRHRRRRSIKRLFDWRCVVIRYAALIPVAFVVLVGIAIAIGKLLRGPSTVEREAVADAPEGCCLNAAKGWDHDPWCRSLPPSKPFVGRAVVAGDDLAWQADLAKIYMAYDEYRFEYRLPGEGR